METPVVAVYAGFLGNIWGRRERKDVQKKMCMTNCMAH